MDNVWHLRGNITDGAISTYGVSTVTTTVIKEISEDAFEKITGIPSSKAILGRYPEYLDAAAKDAMPVFSM